MITLNYITDYLNNELNAALTESGHTNVAFKLVTDGGDYTPPKRSYNNITVFINGVVSIEDSSIIPVNGLQIATRVATAEIYIPIDERGFEASTEYIRGVIDAFFAQAHTVAYTENDKTFEVSVIGSQLMSGERDIRGQIGDSMSYTFNATFNIVQNGVNSLSQKLYFGAENEEGTYWEILPVQSITVSRGTISDGSAFSDSNGAAKNWDTSTVLQIDFSMPMLTNNAFTQNFLEWLYGGVAMVFPMKLETDIGGETPLSHEYSMKFAPSNTYAEAVKNIGMTITLVEAYEVNDNA